MCGAARSAVRALPAAGARAAGSGVVARGGAPGSVANVGTHFLSRQLGAVAGLSQFGRGFAWLGVGVGGSGGGGCGGGVGGGSGDGCWRGGTTATRALSSSSCDGGRGLHSSTF